MQRGKKLKTSGKLTKTKSLDAGQDIHSAVDIRIGSQSSAIISTELFIEVPKDHVALVASRSGLSFKHNLETGAGVIDENYRGEVKVHLYNHGDRPYYVNAGDRIAQLLTMPINNLPYEEVDELSTDDERGTNGIGSSGV